MIPESSHFITIDQEELAEKILRIANLEQHEQELLAASNALLEQKRTIQGNYDVMLEEVCNHRTEIEEQAKQLAAAKKEIADQWQRCLIRFNEIKEKSFKQRMHIEVMILHSRKFDIRKLRKELRLIESHLTQMQQIAQNEA